MARAQGNGTTAGVLLETPATARALALGGAYAAVVGDEGSVFVNPAGMAPVRRMALGGSFEEDFLGSRLTTAAAVLRVGRLHFGFGAMLLEMGGDTVFVEDPGAPGTGIPAGGLINAYNFLGVGAVAYRRGMISLGASGKFLRERIDGGGPSPYTATGVTGDLGIAFAVFDLMALAFVVQNVAGTLTTDGAGTTELPRTPRVGFTINFVDPQGTMRLMTTADWITPPGGNSLWAVGLEGGVVAGTVGLVGRAGISLGRQTASRDPLAWGAGIVVRGLRLDYAHQGWGAAGGASHRIAFRWIP